MNRQKAVVLLSGGLDSATTLYVAKAKGFAVTGLTFDYGQRHKKEVGCARRIAKKAGVPLIVVRIGFPWKGSALLDRRSKLPAGRSLHAMGRNIPLTYVPSRNIIFLSFAASLAEAIGARTVFIGANARDYSGYPDCRPGFLSAMTTALRRGTKQGAQGKGIRICAPLIRMTKAQIIRWGTALKVPYGLTWSCYAGGRRPCGVCDSCRLRQKGFEETGIKGT